MKKILGLAVILLVGFIPLARAEEVDLFKIAIGARALGMGGTGLIRPEANSIFLDPAGLGKLESWQFSSLACSLLGEINYTVLSGALPTLWGTLGLAYVNAGVDNVPITSGYDSSTGEPILSHQNYYNHIISLSYGQNLGRIADWSRDISLGANLKLLNQGLGGADQAQGLELDLGLLYYPLTWLGLGVNLRNALPSSVGGAVTWNTGRKEALPALAKVGVGAQWLKDTLFTELDFDLSVNNPRLPIPLHAGLEFTPLSYLSFRTGIDQEIIPPEGGAGNFSVYNDLTFGLGFNYQGFHFDYAYHPYHVLAENTTHYFSLSFFNPANQVLTSDIKPKVMMTPVELRKSFPDTGGHWAGKTISRMAGLGIVEGRPDGLFYPDDKIIKVEAAKMVLRVHRLKESLPPAVITYKLSGSGLGKKFLAAVDILDDNFNQVKNLEKDKIISFRTYKITWEGYSKADKPVAAGRYHYKVAVNELISGGTLEVVPLLRIYRMPEEGVSPFADVKTKNFWGRPIIAETVKIGLMEGDTAERFGTNRRITRLEMVTAIARALFIDGYGFPDKYEFTYNDAAAIPERSKKYVALYASVLGAGGENGNFNSDKLITRAEAAAILERYLVSKFPE